MPSFVEAELQHRVWAWLEGELECSVWGEVSVSGGRVDVLAETPDGEWWGFEVKGASGEMGMSTVRQVHQYVESPELNRVFYVSNEVDSFLQVIDEQADHYTVDNNACFAAAAAVRQLIDDGVPREDLEMIVQNEDSRLLDLELADRRSFRDWMLNLPDLGWPDHYYEDATPVDPSVEEFRGLVQKAVDWHSDIGQVGVVVVPLNITSQDMYRVRVNTDLSSVIGRGEDVLPVMVRDAVQVPSEESPSPSRDEIELHHAVWKAFPGLVEGAVPNPSERGNRSLSIDFVGFEGGATATDVLRNGDGRVFGVEVKTQSGVRDRKRVRKQLRQYTNAGALTHIFLAVPQSAVLDAVKVVEWMQSEGDEVADAVGVLGITADDSVVVEREADQLSLEYDAYGREDFPYYVGYGNAELADVSDPVSLMTDEDRTGSV